jgi:poly(3-hydroxybutyrate) depolymerase
VATAAQPEDCTWGSLRPGETVQQTHRDGGGSERTYWVDLPSDYDCTPRPLLVGLHGYYGDGEGMERYARMSRRIDELGYIGIFPDGAPMGTEGWKSKVTSFNDIDSHHTWGPDGRTCTRDSYNYGVYDNSTDGTGPLACHWGTSSKDDEAFLRALIAKAQTDWVADPERVFLTGFSQGGQTTQSMAWRLSDVLLAAGPQHGFAANGYTRAPSIPMSLFQVWGTRDRTVDGHDRPSSDGMIYDGARETAEVWADGLGCELAATAYETPFDGEYGWQVEEYPGCSDGVRVVTASWSGGHVWGRKGGVNFALESMLSFFAQLPNKP